MIFISIHSGAFFFSPPPLQEMCSDFNNSHSSISSGEKQLKGAFGFFSEIMKDVSPCPVSKDRPDRSETTGGTLLQLECLACSENTHRFSLAYLSSGKKKLLWVFFSLSLEELGHRLSNRLETLTDIHIYQSYVAFMSAVYGILMPCFDFWIGFKPKHCSS